MEQEKTLHQHDELNQLRNAQLTVLERENELKRRTVEASRRELKERVDTLNQMVQEERDTRRNDMWWSELLLRQGDTTTRVRLVCDSWFGMRKAAEVKKLCLELEERRRLLAEARARKMREMKGEEFMEDVRPERRLHMQNYGEDRSCPSCGYKSADEDDDDDTIVEEDAIPGQQSPNIRSGRVFNLAEAAFLGRFGAQGSVAGTAEPPREHGPVMQLENQALAPRQEQLDADFLLALELQQAEIQGMENAATGGGQGMHLLG